MNKPHKHAALIKQWADGAIIQHYDNNAEAWYNVAFNNPSWNDIVQYRVKPVTRKYRVALMERGGPHASRDEVDAAMLEKHPYFVRWLTDWIEYEV